MKPVYRSKSHQKMIDALRMKDPDTGVAVFSTIKAIQCYAAMLGFEKGVRQDFSRGKDAENIEWHVFDSEGLGQYVYLIALAEVGDVKILKGDSDTHSTKSLDDEMIKIFEEYAEGGFQIMQEWLEKKPGDPYGAEAIMQGLKKNDFLKKPLIKEEFDAPEF